MSDVAYHGIVRGRVQGVGFRYFVFQNAYSRQICGWVKNLASGDVELHVEGPSQAVQDLLRQVREGPAFTFVTSLETAEVECKGFRDFRIVR